MKLLLLASVILLSSARLLLAADTVPLEPNAKISFEFSDLPETFFARSTGQKQPAMLSAQLPENYSVTGHFPLFVFLNGGDGGRGESNTARSIAGARDFITVNLPLFKDAAAEIPAIAQGFDLKALAVDKSGLILPGDGGKLGNAYRVMLQRLFDAVPNVAPERNVLGGFSNGAHATAALLGCQDQFILHHFQAYLLIEGGMLLGLNPKVLDDPALKASRILILTGDTEANPKMQMARALFMEPLLKAVSQQCSANHLDFNRVVMRGYGHELPPVYYRLVESWLHGDPLPEVAPRPSPAQPTKPAIEQAQ